MFVKYKFSQLQSILCKFIPEGTIHADSMYRYINVRLHLTLQFYMKSLNNESTYINPKNSCNEYIVDNYETHLTINITYYEQISFYLHLTMRCVKFII